MRGIQERTRPQESDTNTKSFNKGNLMQQVPAMHEVQGRAGPQGTDTKSFNKGNPMQ